MDSTVSDVAVLDFLARFESWVTDNLGSEVIEPIKRWIADRRNGRLTNLNISVKDDCNHVLDLILKENDADFLEKRYHPLQIPFSEHR